MEALFSLAFFIFFMAVLVLGFRAVVQRIRHFAAGLFGNSFSSYQEMEVQSPRRRTSAWGRAAPAEPIWTTEERRAFGRKIDNADSPQPAAVVREMERELSRLLANASEVEDNLFRWTNELKVLEGDSKLWTDKAAKAVEEGRDMLARAALAEKHKVLGRMVDVQADMERLRQLLSDYRRDVLALEATLAETRRKTVMAQSRLKGADDRARARTLIHGERTAEALASLEGSERRADLIEGHAEAMALGAPGDLSTQLQSLQDEDRIDRELASLKAMQARPAA